MTGRAGLFAGGDMVPAERNVTVAIGHGKKAARHIDAWLRGAADRAGAEARAGDLRALNTWYYTDAPQDRAPAARAGAPHQQLRRGARAASTEATRCSRRAAACRCGNCFECDNCYGVCPDNAVIKLGPGKRFEFNYDYCKGCGICVAECPCGAIEMIPEDV